MNTMLDAGSSAAISTPPAPDNWKSLHPLRTSAQSRTVAVCGLHRRIVCALMALAPGLVAAANGSAAGDVARSINKMTAECKESGLTLSCAGWQAGAARMASRLVLCEAAARREQDIPRSSVPHQEATDLRRIPYAVHGTATPTGRGCVPASKYDR